MVRAVARQPSVSPPPHDAEGSEPCAKGASSSMFDRLAPKVCILASFLLPLKLSLVYIVLVPFLLSFAWLQRKEILRFASNPSVVSASAPLVALLAVALLSSVTGLSLIHSLPSLASLVFFCATVPLFALHANPRLTCTALATGQSVAALHSFFEAAVPGGLSRMFLGHVTESGQLALTIPVAVGLCVMNCASSQSPDTRRSSALLLVSGLLITLSLVSLGFAAEANLSRAVILTLITFAVCGPVAAMYMGVKRRNLPRSVLCLAVIQIPLLICALIVNLKRGPWIGTLLAASVFCFLYARKLVILVVATAITLACSITPVRERLLDSYEHFTISGGRSTIWRIGAELATEYPLGIGYHNSGIMREFAPEIPPELKHFHNNLINITTELGWLGGAIFVWLLCAVLRLCFRDRSAPLYTAIGCALIAWQAAGLFEYNFGDSEITIIVWALVGLVLQREYRQSVLTNPHHN